MAERLMKSFFKPPPTVKRNKNLNKKIEKEVLFEKMDFGVTIVAKLIFQNINFDYK